LMFRLFNGSFKYVIEKTDLSMLKTKLDLFCNSVVYNVNENSAL